MRYKKTSNTNERNNYRCLVRAFLRKLIRGFYNLDRDERITLLYQAMFLLLIKKGWYKIGIPNGGCTLNLKKEGLLMVEINEIVSDLIEDEKFIGLL